MARKQRWLECFVPHRLELMISPSWQQAPIPLRRALERLEIEHLRHGGQNNGHLYVAYNQFVSAGISRRRVKAVLELGTSLGLVEIIQETQTVRGDIRPPNRYRLTYLPKKGASAPTDEWKTVNNSRAEKLVEDFRSSEKETAAGKGKKAA